MNTDDELDKILADHDRKVRNSTGKYYAGNPVEVNAREAKQAILKNYRHIDDIRGAITGKEIDVEATREHMEKQGATEHQILNMELEADDTKAILDQLRQALDIGDSDDSQ